VIKPKKAVADHQIENEGPAF